MNLLVIVLSSQLLYYLLIAQTGVVGAFSSHIHDLYTLPIGGVLGSALAGLWRHYGLKQELCFLFGVQVMVSWIYPNYSLGMLLVLGFLVGYTTPLLLFVFRNQSKRHLAIGLAISYAIGTALYSYPFAQRDAIAIILPMISIVALRFSTLPTAGEGKHAGLDKRVLAVMMLWIFADSALFETLSRSDTMDIWSRYTEVIIASHLSGVFLAYRYGERFMQHFPVIFGLFVASYGAYFLQEPLLLAIVYPIAISYYNVLLFWRLIQIGSIRLLAFSMVGIGWIATSAANAIALEQHLWIAFVVLGGFAVFYPFYFRRVS